jgi:hypothetical protein
MDKSMDLFASFFCCASTDWAAAKKHGRVIKVTFILMDKNKYRPVRWAGYRIDDNCVSGQGTIDLVSM